MGEVWQGLHLALNTQLAVKLVDASAHKDRDEILERFRIEGQAAGRLRSPHIVQIFDYGTEGNIAYMAMELLEGETLSDRLVRAGRFSIADTARVLHEIALGVALAHEQGIVHRDLKPQNVFLAKIGGRVTVKVLDFGIAKLTAAPPTDTLKTHAGMMVGTPAYMSPEQVMGNTQIDWRSDLWQMGIIAFECVCGKMPFEATSLGDLFMRICSAPLPVPSKFGPASEAFDAWFARAMQRDPEKRFQSAKEMAEALAAIVPAGAARRTVQSDLFRENAQASLWSGDKAAEPNRKSLAVIAIIAALSTVALVSAVLWFFAAKGEDPARSPSPSPSLSATNPSSTPETPSSAAVPSPPPAPTVAPSGPASSEPTPPASPTAPSTTPPAIPKPPKKGGRAEDIFGI
ncbi:MAG: serine/threonine protein kinase [Polyangiaceae bacterium]|nr:serine/threonine protein kinase [Polyangiaceae bacterium]NUQ78110.1 serine/threonine protein kinase [Polyangiaceae bacterium]